MERENKNQKKYNETKITVVAKIISIVMVFGSVIGIYLERKNIIQWYVKNYYALEVKTEADDF